MNDYEKFASKYQESHSKPDKLFSILPTVISLAGDVNGKVMVDLGCGDGFFTRAFAQLGPKKVIGIDNSIKQLALAHQKPQENVDYRQSDIFKDPIPEADLILVPFVANYAQSTEQLKSFARSIYTVLKKEGRVLMVVDLPNGKNLKQFGAVKTFMDSPKEGAPIRLDLYKNDELIISLNAHYFSKKLFDEVLQQSGFSNIQWHKPIVSEEGTEKYGAEFWAGYIDDPELGYLTADKV